MLVGPVNVLLAGVTKSTWNVQRLSELVPKLSRKFGVPAGGAEVVPTAPLAPSRSEGRREAKLGLNWKHTCVAAAPASIALRLKAQALAPWNTLVNMLKVT